MCSPGDDRCEEFYFRNRKMFYIELKVRGKVSQWLASGRWLSSDTPVSSTNNADCHDITEILLKVAFIIILTIESERYPRKIMRSRRKWSPRTIYLVLRFHLSTHVKILIIVVHPRLTRSVRRYQRSNQNPLIEGQTKQWPKRNMTNGQTTIYKTLHRKLKIE